MTNFEHYEIFWNFCKGAEAIINSKQFVKDHLGLDIIINETM